MRRQKLLQQTILSVLSFLWIVIFIILQIIIKHNNFVGIKPEEVVCVTKVYDVQYRVVSMKQITNDSGESTYKITFKDIGEDAEKTAPVCTIEMQKTPVDMTLGSVYNAQWVNTIGTYEEYSREKDSVVMSFSSETPHVSVQEMKAEVTNALVNDLSKLLSSTYYIEVSIALVVFVAVCLLLIKISESLSNKLFVPTDYDYAQLELDKVQATVLETDEEVLTNSINMLQELYDNQTVKKQRPVKKLRSLQDSIDHPNDTSTDSIDVESALKDKANQSNKEQHKFKPVGDSIVL